MKRIIPLIILIFPIAIFSQKINKSEYDKFIKKYRIETNTIDIQKGLVSIPFGFSSLDSSTFLFTFNYNHCNDIFGEEDKIIFLLSDDSTIETGFKKSQFYKLDVWMSNTYLGYFISLDAIKKLQSAIVKAIRIYNKDGYIDIKIRSGEAKDINVLANVFLKEFQEKQARFQK